MKIFREVLNKIIIYFNASILGQAIFQTFQGKYKVATIELFVVVGLFIIGYFVERFNNIKEWF